jgi:hypothetical protein
MAEQCAQTTEEMTEKSYLSPIHSDAVISMNAVEDAENPRQTAVEN